MTPSSTALLVKRIPLIHSSVKSGKLFKLFQILFQDCKMHKAELSIWEVEVGG